LPNIAVEIDELIRARYPILYLLTWEENRAKQILLRIAQDQKKDIFEWSVTDGLRHLAKLHTKEAYKEHSRDPLVALNHVLQSTIPALYVFKDFHLYLKKPEMIRQMRDVAHTLRQTKKTLIIVAPVLDIPTELEKSVTIIDLPLPRADNLGALLDKLVRGTSRDRRLKVDLPPEGRANLVKAALGLTLEEAENAFARAMVKDGVLSAVDIPAVLEEKKQVIRKSGLLEYFSTDERVENVGGMDVLKDWLVKRRNAFTDEARAYGLPEPKGALLLGIQGCGKSLLAKTVATLWSLPLLRLDMSLIFSGFIGASESNMRKAIKTAESIAPTVLWIDEIEKAFSGVASSSISDAGTTARVVGTFLTWIQEKNSAVFVIATANSIESLPPELLRKGRFDEVFFVDLPTPRERREIFTIHVAKRKRDPKAYDLDLLARESDGFSGSEIEEAIVSGMHDSFAEKRELETRDILNALRETVPLSVTMKEKISFFRKWMQTRARPASSETPHPLAERDREPSGR
jgi:AAA+ superfamily predicted ATPase